MRFRDAFPATKTKITRRIVARRRLLNPSFVLRLDTDLDYGD
jgi:hypothetical protein